MADHPTGIRPPEPTAPAKPGGRLVAWSAFALGSAASIAANMAHASYPTDQALARWIGSGRSAADWAPPVGAMLAAAFAPVALILVVEIMTRVPWPTGRRWAVGRWVGSTLVAVVAAVVSYRHLRGLLLAYGEDELTATILPLGMDGLMLVASVALLALSEVNRTTTNRRPTATDDVAEPTEAPTIRLTVDLPVDERPATSVDQTTPEPRRPAEHRSNGRPPTRKPTGRPTTNRPVRLVHGPTAVADAAFLREQYGDDQSADHFPGRNELLRRHSGNAGRWSAALKAHADRADQPAGEPDRSDPDDPEERDRAPVMAGAGA